MAANCTHHPPSVISWLLNKSHTKRKILFITKNKNNFLDRLKKRKKKRKKKKEKTGPLAEKRQDIKSNQTRQHQKRGDGQEGSNDSLITDRETTSNIPNILSTNSQPDARTHASTNAVHARSHTHTHTHARARARLHAHRHTRIYDM